MTEPIGPASQYASAKPFYDQAKASSSNLSGSPEDQDRLRAYALYEDMYHNRPETFKVFIRSDEDEGMEVYVPSAKKMVEAMNRFLAKGYRFVVDPNIGDKAAQELAVLRLENLAKREKLIAKFSNQKRMGLVRGDACFYITADPNKPQHSRLSINELNPANYFPIKDPRNSQRLLGFHIVEVVQDPRESEDRTKTLAKRQTYLKNGVSYVQARGRYEEEPNNVKTGIFYEVTHWEVGKWDDRYMKFDDLEKVVVEGDVPMAQLNPLITTLPVYHWKNGVSDTTFGNSELSGIETLIMAVNQTMTDEAITIILQGIGVYTTDSKPPRNTDGTPANWDIGPGSVIETAEGKRFERVSGVSSVDPFQAHIAAAKEGMQEGNGIPDIAAGKVDVTVAESGISLQLQLAPILASAEEKEQEILAIMDHMLYDIINQWYPAYEQESFEGISVASFCDNAMPVNREARVQEVLLLFTSGLITIAMAQAELSNLGYNFQAGDDLKVLKEQAAIAAAQNGDNRYAQELEPTDRTLNSGAGQQQQPLAPADAPSTPATISV